MSQFGLDPEELSTVEASNLETRWLIANSPPFDFADLSGRRFIRSLTNTYLLDIGCGYGRSVPALQQAGVIRYLGIDPADNMLAVARKAQPGLDFRSLNLYELPEVFAEATFDAFMAMNVLFHVTPKKLPYAVNCIRRVLRPGAPGLINMLSPQGKVRTLSGKVLSERKPGPRITMHGWNMDELFTTIQNGGFIIEHCSVEDFFATINLRAV